jgi:hypothetical protein
MRTAKLGWRETSLEEETTMSADASVPSPAAPAGTPTSRQSLANLIEVVFPRSTEAASLMQELGVSPSQQNATTLVYNVDVATHRQYRCDFEQLGAPTY